MSQPPNPNKYDALLNQFLKSDSLLVENESEQLKRWLEEAESNLRGQFQNHRGKTTDKFVLIAMKGIFLGNVGQINSIANEEKMEFNNTNELEAAMSVSLPSDSSDEELHEESGIVFINFFL